MEYKILIAGPCGAGKTTAVHAVSDIAAISSEVRNTDSRIAKPFTTAGLDYGQITLDNGEQLAVYGTPGQERFDFMWSILSQGALGIILLMDNSQANPLAVLDVYLRALAPTIGQGIHKAACVVGVGRMEQHPAPGIDDFAAQLQVHGIMCPVVPVDVREKSQVLDLIELLLLQIEATLETATP